MAGWPKTESMSSGVKPSIKHDEKYNEDSKNSFQNESAGFSHLNSSYKSDCINTN